MKIACGDHWPGNSSAALILQSAAVAVLIANLILPLAVGQTDALRACSQESHKDGPVVPTAASALTVAALGDPNVDTDTDLAYDNLVGWLTKSGALFLGVSGHKSLLSGGRSLVTTAQASEGDLLFTIPSHCWFSEDTIAANSAVGHLFATDDEVRKACQPGSGWNLILALDYERHNKLSPWRAYIDSLPDPTSPVTWGSAYVGQFQSPTLSESVLGLQEYIREKYDALFPRLSETYPAMFPREVHSLDSFTWAALTVWSRAFDLGAWESTVPMWGMVPFADLANHAPFVPISYSIDENSYEFVAPVSLESGEEIFISYGDGKTTFHYIMFLGFEIGDFIVVSVANSVLAKLKSRGREDLPAFLQKALESPVGLTGFVGADGHVHDDFLALLDAACEGTKTSAIDTLLRGVTVVLERFQTTLEQDETTMAKRRHAYHEENVAVATRMRFKKILRTLWHNLRHRKIHGEWMTPRMNDSVVYRFDDERAGLTRSDAAKEGLFLLSVVV